MTEIDHMNRGWAWRPVIALVPLGAAAAVQTIEYALYHLTVVCDWVIPAAFWCRTPAILVEARSAPELASVVNEIAAARFNWHGMMVLLVMMILTAVVYTGFKVWEGVRAAPRVRLAIAGAVILLGGAVACVFGWKGGTHIALVPLLRAAPADVASEAHAFASMARAIATFAGVLVTAAACATLVVAEPLRSHAASAADRDSAGIAQQIKALETVLIMGSAVLVAALLEYRAFIGWMRWYGRDPNGFLNVGGAVLTANGITYTLLLGAIYVSGSHVLRQRAKDLATAALPYATTPDRGEWLDHHGIAFSWPKAVRTAVAVLAPFVVGSPLARVLSGLAA